MFHAIKCQIISDNIFSLTIILSFNCNLFGDDGHHYVLLPTNFSLRLKIDTLPDNHSFIFLLGDYEIMCVSFHLFLRWQMSWIGDRRTWDLISISHCRLAWPGPRQRRRDVIIMWQFCDQNQILIATKFSTSFHNILIEMSIYLSHFTLKNLKRNNALIKLSIGNKFCCQASQFLMDSPYLPTHI